MNYNEESIKLHKEHRGKIELGLKVSLDTKDDLSIAYTPGVAAVCQEIAQDKFKVNILTNRASQVAIVTDGTAILGLGDIGPEAGLPVMEGKAAIFKKFANIDAIPMCIATKNVDEIVDFIKNIQPTFAGINLEDISAPRCFEITRRLEDELDVPFFHDDQDGTAIVVLGGLINAAKVLNKDLKNQKILINGAGAAGLAIARLLLNYGIKDIVVLDSKGVITEDRNDLNEFKKAFLKDLDIKSQNGDLQFAIKERDIFIGVSKAGVLTKDMVSSMNENPIIFAMANPVPEIMPEEAYLAGAGIVGTGRSDFANQINNALVFPGLFKGLLKNNIKKVTMDIKLAVAQAIASSVEPEKDKLLPLITENKVLDMIVQAIDDLV